MNRKRKFWTARLVFVLLNAPAIVYMQVRRPDLLMPYLVWMSYITWLEAVLPSDPD